MRQDSNFRSLLHCDSVVSEVFELTRIPLLLVAVYCTHALAQNQTPAPIDAEGRMKWFVRSSVGPASLAGGVISAGWGTMLNSPREYGPHWDGFGKRYGMRLTGVVTGNAMEASLGAVWGLAWDEDDH